MSEFFVDLERMGVEVCVEMKMVVEAPMAENMKRKEGVKWSLHEGLEVLSLEVCDTNSMDNHHTIMRCQHTNPHYLSPFFIYKPRIREKERKE